MYCPRCKAEIHRMGILSNMRCGDCQATIKRMGIGAVLASQGLALVFIVFFVLLFGTETVAFVLSTVAASVLAIGIVWWFSTPYVDDEQSTGRQRHNS